MRLNLSAKHEISIARLNAPNPLFRREKKFSKKKFATEPKNFSRTIQSQNRYKTAKKRLSNVGFYKEKRWYTIKMFIWNTLIQNELNVKLKIQFKI